MEVMRKNNQVRLHSRVRRMKRSAVRRHRNEAGLISTDAKQRKQHKITSETLSNPSRMASSLGSVNNKNVTKSYDQI